MAGVGGVTQSSCYESDCDFSDSGFARATAGSRGKSANSVMMKLAKKFSKKNLPITRDEGDGVSVGGDSVGKGEGSKLKQRSNSVSNLDSVEGYVYLDRERGWAKVSKGE